MRKIVFLLCCTAIAWNVQSQTKRPLKPADIYRLQNIGNAAIAPDGNWVVYSLSTVDSAKDKRDDNIWMISWDGKQNIQLTFSKESESSPAFSPDGKYISFISARADGSEDEDDKDQDLAQVWLLDRRGGEAKKVTNVKGDIDSYIWSPDGKKLLLIMKDQDFSDTAASEVRKPFVMDRFHFKQDYIGYLDHRATHFYLLDIDTKNIDTLTTGLYDEGEPDFSPDGKQIVFSSNRTEDPDKNENADIYVMDAKPGAAMKKLTTWAGTDHAPKWSPDGKKIAYLQSSSDQNFTMYGQDMVAVMDAGGGNTTILSKAIDRPFTNLRWSKDGKLIYALTEDDRESNIVSFDAANGTYAKVTQGQRATYALEVNTATGNLLALMSEPHLPFELFTVQNNTAQRLTHVQDAFLATLELPVVEGFQSRSSDGNLVSGILYTPANATGKKLPLIMFIHGGPVAQDDYSFDIVPQMMAAAGFAVAQVNYRGSSGRGVEYTKAIYSDWGNKEVLDILGAVDYLTAKGVADPNRVGIGGWSYGGILTDYSIAADPRFKAACSGAGSALQLSMYGVDQYVTQYETELGVPWKNADKWIKLSYPFFHADKIKTPTLFMAGEKDFNVPSVGAEQMYQALKSNGVPAQLVIYPGQNHGISIPGYQVDRCERYLAWFGKYLQ